MSYKPWEESFDDYLDEVLDENAVVREVQKLPEGWTAVHLRALLPLIAQGGGSASRVLLAILDAAEPYIQEIKISLRELAKRSGASIGTVIQSVRYWEDQGVIVKTSLPNQDSRWRVNPAYGCKVFPGECQHGQ